MSLKIIEGFTLSEDPESHEVVMHCREDFDDRFNCLTPEHKQNLLNIVEAIILAESGVYLWYIVPENKLRKYTTLKADSDKKKFKRPDEDTID